jgi:hypothetical protein
VEYPAEGGTLLQVNSSGWPEAAEKNSEGIRYDANCSASSQANHTITTFKKLPT